MSKPNNTLLAAQRIWPELPWHDARFDDNSAEPWAEAEVHTPLGTIEFTAEADGDENLVAMYGVDKVATGNGETVFRVTAPTMEAALTDGKTRTAAIFRGILHAVGG